MEKDHAVCDVIFQLQNVDNILWLNNTLYYWKPGFLWLQRILKMAFRVQFQVVIRHDKTLDMPQNVIKMCWLWPLPNCKNFQKPMSATPMIMSIVKMEEMAIRRNWVLLLSRLSCQEILQCDMVTWRSSFDMLVMVHVRELL